MKDSNGKLESDSGAFRFIRWARAQDLPPGPKFVLMTLASYADTRTGECYPSQLTLAEDCGFEVKETIRKDGRVEKVIPRRLQRNLRVLRDAGLIEVEGRQVGPRNQRNMYRLIDRTATMTCGPHGHNDVPEDLAARLCGRGEVPEEKLSTKTEVPESSFPSSSSSLECARVRARCLPGEGEKEAKKGNTDQVGSFPQENGVEGELQAETAASFLTARGGTASVTCGEEDEDYVATDAPACPFMKHPELATGAGV